MPHDEFHHAYARELGRLVAGIVLEIGDPESGIPDEATTVARLRSVTVGVDDNGLFCGLTVVDEDGREFTLYNDGTVADADDHRVGRHRLTTAGGDPWIALAIDGPKPFRICDLTRDYSYHYTFEEAKAALAELRVAPASLRVAS